MEVKHRTQGRGNILELKDPATTISWATIGGGIRQGTRTIVNHYIGKHDDVTPEAVMSAVAGYSPGINFSQAVVMSTAVPARSHFWGSAEDEKTGLAVRVFVTAGLGNRRAFDDPPEWNEELEEQQCLVGTINLIVLVNRQLTDEALCEEFAMIAQMKSSIIASFGIPSPLTGEVISGTGSDCTVLCAPQNHPVVLKYAGLHTVFRSVTWRALMAALRPAIDLWIQEAPASRRGLYHNLT